MLLLILAGIGTALATGLGAVPVFFLGERAREIEPVLWGLAAGLMAVASVVGLLAPALDHGSRTEVAAGLAIGVLFLAAARHLVGSLDPSIGGLSGADVRTSVLVFAVLLVHSLPEGFAIGTAYQSDTAGLSLFVILAIALQNVPEGTSVAIPMREAGFGPARQFWAAVATSAPQPLGAVIAYLLVREVSALLPISFAFAAGAMLALVAAEMLPRALSGGRPLLATAGMLAGAAAMLGLSAALGV